MVTNEARMEAGKKIRAMDEEFKKRRKGAEDFPAAAGAQRLRRRVTSNIGCLSEEMPKAIIGRKAKCPRSKRLFTGVDIIDDTPEVILSGFPVRREVARIALTRLVQDGRIHPARMRKRSRK